MRCRQRGFTLVEVLVATGIITVGLGGITVMLQLAAASNREGRLRSAAIFLATERVELLRSAGWNASGDCLGVSPTTARPPVTSTCPHAGVDHVTFPDEERGALPSPFETFTRAVRVQPCASLETCPVISPDLRLITIVVGHGSQGIVSLHGLVARRF